MEIIEKNELNSKRVGWQSNILLVISLSLGVGVFSGFVNVIGDSFMGLGVGASYGIITLLWFLFLLHGKLVRNKIVTALLWITGSFLSFFVAVLSSLLVDFLFPLSSPVFVFSFSGLVGVIILATSFHFIFWRIDSRVFIWLCVLGGIIPLLSGTQDGGIIFGTLPNMTVLFLLWQGVITAILGYAVVKDSQN